MPRHILAAVLPGPRAAHVLERARLIAASRGSRLTVLTALHTGPVQATGLAIAARKAAQDAVLAELAPLMRDAGLSGAPVVRFGRPAVAIERAVEEFGADFIVMGPNERRNLRTQMIGSTADRVLRRTHVPVLIARRQPPGDYYNVLVAVDFSPACSAAAQIANRIFPQARIQLAHVAELPADMEQALLLSGQTQDRITAFYHELMEAGRAELALFAKPWPRARQRVFAGAPAEVLTQLSRTRGVDLIVMGTRGLDTVMTNVLGSMAQKVIRDAASDVLIVPADAPPEPEPGHSRG
ncbi:universal stress protein [Plastorhodobacter daqingensis]|uniref:Universal stress protein n=1 Tax=Plastorhodobacter daqingensis TaxID=1387281 RepID=A0ABW2UFS9_9RHOB